MSDMTTDAVAAFLAGFDLVLEPDGKFELAGAAQLIIRRFDAAMIGALEDNLRRWGRHVLEGRAPNSIAALKADWRVYASWCTRHKARTFPASQSVLERFLKDQGQSKKISTVRRYLTSIGALHAGSGLPNPCTSPRIHAAAAALHGRQARRNRRAREDGSEPPLALRQAQGLREDHLAALTDQLDDSMLRDRRTAAVLWTAHDTLLRASELRQVRWRDFEPGSDGGQVLFVPYSKSDQLGTGSTRYVAPATWQHLLAWRTAAESNDPELFARNDLVFRTLRGQRVVQESAMSRQAIWRLVKKAAQQLGLDPTRFSAHSTRVGTAQDMLDADIGLLAVMISGGWKTPTMPAHYARGIDVQHAGAAKLARLRGRSGGKRPGGGEASPGNAGENGD